MATNVAHTINRESLLGLLPIATDAPFDSSFRRHEPLCLPDTRMGVLSEIRSWADGQDERSIFWLSGIAGTGKSTIARTIAHSYCNKGRLGASFFFERGGGDTSHAGKFFTSIASQLANQSDILQSHICDAIQMGYGLDRESFSVHWSTLILPQLYKLRDNSPPLLLVVDALDECDVDVDIKIILECLSDLDTMATPRLRILITSRPELAIQFEGPENLNALNHELLLHRIPRRVVNKDISIVFNEEFREKRRTLGPASSEWPSEKSVDLLLQRAGGLFIFAATVCRFLNGDIKRPPQELLETLISGDESDSQYNCDHGPTWELDKIYTKILQVSFKKIIHDRDKLVEPLKQIIGSLVSLFDPLSDFALAGLLDLPQQWVKLQVESLNSVLNIPKESQDPIRLAHPSFRDFFQDKKRCLDQTFWIPECQRHKDLLDCCLRLLSGQLRKDVCQLRDPGSLVLRIDNTLLQRKLSPQVRYACIYWIHHLQRSGDPLHDDGNVHRFLKDHLLHWLEALGWMGKLSEGIRVMTSLEGQISADVSPDMNALYYDIRQFTLYNLSGIELAPLQLYCSAIAFAPSNSIVRNRFETQIPLWVHRRPKVQANWNALLRTIEGHSSYVKSIAFSPDSKVVASASDDKTVRLWDTVTGAALQTLVGHSASVILVAFSPDGKIVLSASDDNTVRLWNAATGEPLRTLDIQSKVVTSVAFSADCRVVAWADSDKSFTLWDTATGAILLTFMDLPSPIRLITFSQDNKLVASASVDRTVRLWNVASGAMLQNLEGHMDSVQSVVFSPDSKVVASASSDATIRLWDAATGSALQIWSGHLCDVDSLAFSPDGKMVASGGYDQIVRLWNSSTGATVRMLRGHQQPITLVAFSPDSKIVISTSDDQTMRFWDAATGAILRTIEVESSALKSVVVSPDGNLIAAKFNTTFGIWRAAMDAPLKTLQGHSHPVRTVVFSSDGNVVASASYDETVRLWDSATGALLQSLEGHSYSVNSVTFSPNNRVVASASYDATVRLWDAATGSVLQILKGHSFSVMSVAFSPDGKVVASASRDETVRLWDAATGATLHTLVGHSLSVVSVKFSPDGNTLASASWDRTVKLWDATTGAMLQTLAGHSLSVSSVAFSPDGKFLASASCDNTVKLWDSATGVALQTFKFDIPIGTLSFCNSGQYLKTDRGLLSLQSLGASLSFSDVSLSLSVIDDWVIENGKRLLWLPADYRATCMAVWNDLIVLGHPSGTISFLQFGKGLKIV